MTDLQLAAGLLNASRNANRARQAAEQHLEEARTAARYAQEAAAAAKDGAAAEKERLALEKARFAAEQRERSLRAQALEQQQQARELLADALQECSELAPSATAPASSARLTYQLAGLQAKVLILEDSREALTELADKTAVRQLRGQAAACIQSFADRGVSPGDPWTVARLEIARMRGFVARGKALVADGQQLADNVQRATAKTLSHEDWQTLRQRVEDFRSRWSAQLSELKNSAGTDWWEAGKDTLDPAWQGLLLLEALVPTETPTAAKDRSPEQTISDLQAWRTFSRGRGKVHDEIMGSLDRTQETLTARNEDYLADLPNWKRVLALAEAGNYLQAHEALEACRNRVTDETHRRCVQAIVGWRTGLRELVGAPLPQELQRQTVQPWPLLPHAFRAEARTRRGVIESARKWLGSKARPASEQETDFSRKAATGIGPAPANAPMGGDTHEPRGLGPAWSGDRRRLGGAAGGGPHGVFLAAGGEHGAAVGRHPASGGRDRRTARGTPGRAEATSRSREGRPGS